MCVLCVCTCACVCACVPAQTCQTPGRAPPSACDRRPHRPGGPRPGPRAPHGLGAAARAWETRGGLHWQARSHLAAGIRIEDADPRAEAEKRAEWRAPQRPTPCSPRAGRGAARTAQPENTNLLRSLPSPRARVFVRKRENERAGASEGGFHLVIGNEKGPEPEAAFGSCRGAPPTPPLLPDAP